jgi:hypothetical protein
LWGVEPEEIDLANDGTTSGVSAGSSNGDGDTGFEETGNDGDDDPTGQGDGDGDPGDGDGDPGDGDGDPGDGDGDPGDGDGENDGSGDGDGDADLPCASLEPIAVVEDDNAIDIPDVASSFEGSCGSPGPEAVFSFTATSDASYGFTLSSDAFEGVLYLVGGSCHPLDELACELEGQAIIHDMLVGEVVYIIVDSDAGPGAATLTIATI